MNVFLMMKSRFTQRIPVLPLVIFVWFCWTWWFRFPLLCKLHHASRITQTFNFQGRRADYLWFAVDNLIFFGNRAVIGLKTFRMYTDVLLHIWPSSLRCTNVRVPKKDIFSIVFKYEFFHGCKHALCNNPNFHIRHHCPPYDLHDFSDTLKRRTCDLPERYKNHSTKTLTRLKHSLHNRQYICILIEEVYIWWFSV